MGVAYFSNILQFPFNFLNFCRSDFILQFFLQYSKLRYILLNGFFFEKYEPMSRATLGDILGISLPHSPCQDCHPMNGDSCHQVTQLYSRHNGDRPSPQVITHFNQISRLLFIIVSNLGQDAPVIRVINVKVSNADIRKRSY